MIAKSERLIKSGDIITRTGNDFTSDCLRKLNRHDQTYSHCGIASIEKDTVFIYHSIGGDINPDQKIKRDPYREFVDPSANKRFGIFRMQIGDSMIRNIITKSIDLYTKEIRFDIKFDLQTDDRMYCSEFIAKSINQTINSDKQIPVSKIKDFRFIGIDDITGMPFIENIYSGNYFNQ